MKEIVLEAIRKFYDEGYKKGHKDGMILEDDIFIDSPSDFYKLVIERAEGLSDFEPRLFTAPCSICGEPIIFTHEDWASEAKPTLLNAFKDRYHET